MLIENTLLGRVNKVDRSVMRFKEFGKVKENSKVILAFSGGKDSMAEYRICEMSGIDFEAIYSPTSVDPPELIQFIKKYYPKVKFNKYPIDKNGTILTMFNLIPKKLMPPTIMVRYCCEVLKERTGDHGDRIFTGVRWAESSSRKKQSMVNFWKGKTIIRPIVDWSDKDVWEFIKAENLPYCELYDQGWDRIGCVGCPKNPKNMIKELDWYPKFKENYIRAFDRMLENRKLKEKPTQWKSGEEVMDWWVRKNISQIKQLEGQCSMF